MSNKTIAIVGNPNCGKSTLFNMLTGKHRHVGNRAGVTVTVGEGRLRTGETDFSIVDLPGIYDLSGNREDEAVALRYLSETPPDAILNIADENMLERQLSLTCQLASLGLPMMLVLNMHDEAIKRGIHTDTALLSKALGIPVLQISAAHRLGLGALRELLVSPLPSPWPRREKTAAEFFATAQALAEAVQTGGEKKNGLSVWTRHTGYGADRLFLHPIWGLPLFLLCMLLLFTLTFYWPGGVLGDWVSDFVCIHVGNAVRTLCEDLPPFLYALCTDGIWQGISGVLSFFPQILLLSLLITLLEDSGYMARGVFLTDRLFADFGLSGNCFIPMLLGFGCNVPAIMATRTLSSPSERRRTAVLVPFMSCGARMPVYLMLVNMFFQKSAGAIILSLYLTGILVAAVTARIMGKKRPPVPFLTELPPYRLPMLRNILRAMWEKTHDFALRTAGLLVLASAAVWVLSSFDFAFRPTTSDSMLQTLGRYIAPIFVPAGFGNAIAAGAILAGIAAKEAIVTTFAVTGQIALSPAGAYSFMVFILLYTPCMAAISVMRREVGSRITLFAVAYQTAVAYLAATAVYTILSHL
ncbi:MAG: ferrous iron transporter B [Clostridia bacterium]|nr:ferrous iron transporter B [Clostridia bacterium]